MGTDIQQEVGRELIELLNLDRADGHFHGVGELGEQGPAGCMN